MARRTDLLVREMHPSLANVTPLPIDNLKDNAYSVDITISRESRQNLQHEMERQMEKGTAVPMAMVFQLPKNEGNAPITATPTPQ